MSFMICESNHQLRVEGKEKMTPIKHFIALNEVTCNSRVKSTIELTVTELILSSGSFLQTFMSFKVVFCKKKLE